MNNAADWYAEEEYRYRTEPSRKQKKPTGVLRVRRCDIYMADLTGDPLDRHGKVRPVIIIQNDKGNQSSDSFIAAIITSRPKKNLPTHITLGTDCGLRKNSTVLCEHIVTVKGDRLLKYMGTISGTKEEKRLDRALCISLQIRKR